MPDLGPPPEPQIEPGEPNPGGVDALPREAGRATPDLPPEENPATDGVTAADAVLAEVGEGEDTSTSATRDEEHDPDDESPA